MRNSRKRSNHSLGNITSCPNLVETKHHNRSSHYINNRHMHLTPVAMLPYYSGTLCTTMNVLPGHGADSYSLLYQSVEKLSAGTGCSTVEPKCVFIKVVVKMKMLHPALVGSQQPSLEQCSNAVDLRQHIPANSSFFSDDFMHVAQFGQAPIASPSICLDSAPRLDSLLNGSSQAGARCIRYAPESNSPDPTFFKLYHNNNQRLACCSSAPLSWFLPTYEDLVCLHRARKSVPSRSYHGTAELVHPRPSRMIAAQTKQTLQSQRVCSIFLTRHVPDSTKPKQQRLLCVLKNCTSRNGSLEATTSTVEQIPLCGPCFLMSTLWASKPFWPANLEQILKTRFLSSKSFLKIEQGSRIVLHTCILYRLRLLETSAYAYIFIIRYYTQIARQLAK